MTSHGSYIIKDHWSPDGVEFFGTVDASWQKSSGELLQWTQPNTVLGTFKTYIATLFAGAAAASFPLTIPHMALTHSAGSTVVNVTPSASGSKFIGTGTFSGALTTITGGTMGRNLDTIATMLATTVISLSLGASDTLVLVWTVTVG